MAPPRTVTVFALLPFALLPAAAALGCAPTAKQRAEAEIAAIRKESDADTLLERGKAFAAIGDHTRAEEYLASALDAGADPREVLPLLMEVCVKTGRYRSAIQHGENHLRRHPNDHHTRIMVGALYAALDEAKHARAQLERVLGDMPDDDELDDEDEEVAASPAAEGEAGEEAALRAQAHYILAIVARDTDRNVVEADRHFRAYLRIAPNGSHAEEARASLLKRIP